MNEACLECLIACTSSENFISSLHTKGLTLYTLASILIQELLLLLKIILPQIFMDPKYCLWLEFWFHSSTEGNKRIFLHASYVFRTYSLSDVSQASSTSSQDASGSETCHS